MNNLDKNKKSEPLLTKNEIYFLSAFFGFIFAVLYYTFFVPNYSNGQFPKAIEISQGSTFDQVVDSLYNKKIIPSKTNMKIAAVLYGGSESIKAGKYEISKGLNYFDLLELLIKGSPLKEKLVTIPEGIWQENLAGLLRQQLGLDSAKIMKLSKSKSFINSLGLQTDNLEGYLLPNTYYFYVHSSEEMVLRKLERAMSKIFADPTVMRQMKKLKMNERKILILASIIDGESNKVSEFKRIAGVYYNRIKKGIKLQADPTIQYLIRNYKHHNKIYYKYLEIKSPYNTYIYYGLPPGPINNPGKAAIMAALYPEKNDFYYFVADGSGGHRFSRTLSQHLVNIKKYRQWRRKHL